MSARPRRVVLVTGTGTDVGKTWVGAAVLRLLRDDGWVVAARKPAQSFDADDAARHDGDVLSEATGEDPDVVCPPHRGYETPMAPPMAAAALGRPAFAVAALVAEVGASWPARAVDLGLVELAGGWRSPQAAPGAGGDDGPAFAAALTPDVVVVVADAGLGTIHAVRSVTSAVDGQVVTVLNRFDPAEPLHVANRNWLTGVDGLDVVTSPHELATRLRTALGSFCVGCGRSTDECAGCLPALESPRHCPRCARRLTVVVAPTTVSASCRVHGEV